MLASIGIIKGQPFSPDPHTRDLLDKGARTAYHIGHANSYQPPPILTNGYWYPDRKWVNVFPGNATFSGDTFNFIDPRVGILHLRVLGQSGHGRQHGERRREISRELCGRRWQLPEGRPHLQAHAAAEDSRRAVLVGDRV